VVWRELLFQVRDGFPQQVTVTGGVYAGVVSHGFDPQHVGTETKKIRFLSFTTKRSKGRRGGDDHGRGVLSNKNAGLQRRSV
jgi:hypothetical protein